MRRLRADRRGATGLVIALALPVLIGCTAFAVDVGAATLQSRRLQGIADAAAIAAAGDPAHAQALAESTVAASGWSGGATVTVQTGSYDRNAATPAAARFSPGAAGADAVRVAIESPMPTFFGRIFGQRQIVLGRHAIAARERMAAFSIGSRLAALNGGLLNAYLSALTGSSIALSVMDYNALASVDVDVFGYLDALRTTAHLDAATFQDVVDARVTRGQALSALASALQGAHPAEAAVLRRLAVQAGAGELSLSALIDPGKLGGSSGGLTGSASMNALAAATAILQIASPQRQVSLDLGASVPGLAATRLTIAIGERPAHSPWLTITDNGTPVIRTAQARLYLETQVGGVALPGAGSVASVRVPVFVELASAEARLGGIDCSTASSRGVTIEARPSPGTAAIAALDTARLGDFTNPVPLSAARIVDTPLVDVDGSAVVDLGTAEQWQQLRFSAADIAAARIQTISSGTIVQGVAASLAARVALTVRVVGLPIPVTPISQAVGSQLALVAPALDGLIDATTGALGVHVGQADIQVTGMRCGTAVLVA